MLGNFMEDIGISPEQFENACKEGKKYQVSFDQVINISILSILYYFVIFSEFIRTDMGRK